jgi:hypothetical protein
VTKRKIALAIGKTHLSNIKEPTAVICCLWVLMNGKPYKRELFFYPRNFSINPLVHKIIPKPTDVFAILETHFKDPKTCHLFYFGTVP